MEKQIGKKSTVITVIGIHEGVGKSLIGLAIAKELTRKNYRVIFGRSHGDSKQDAILLPDSTNSKNLKNEINFIPSKMSGIDIMVYSDGAEKISPQKMQELTNELPERVSEKSDFFIFSLSDHFSFPDRYILLNTDIYVMVLQLGTSVFSDLFQSIEKFAFMPAKPKCIYLIFNGTSDIEKAYFTYRQIVRQAEEFSITIDIKLLGVVPNDYIRNVYSNREKTTINSAFSDCAFSGSISFVTERIEWLAQKKTTTDKMAMIQ